jgi:DNA-binding MarR family transcriptional regulator
MQEKAQIKLSPIERAARNSLVVYLFQAGCGINSIGRIMNMHQSTVSRIITKDEYRDTTVIEIIQGGK